MRLKNYQEDVVLDAIRVALEERDDVEENEDFIKDVAAYVLNRIPPRYIMSERGFVRMASEFYQEDKKTLVNAIELMLLVNRGIELVQNRPRPGKNGDNHWDEEEEIEELGNNYLHTFPQLLGRVVDKQSGAALGGVKVTLTIDGKLAESAEPTWANPYTTREQTKGFYSFWPKAYFSDKKVQSHTFEISIEHPDYNPTVITEDFITKAFVSQPESYEEEHIKHIPLIKLSPAEVKH